MLPASGTSTGWAHPVFPSKFSYAFFAWGYVGLSYANSAWLDFCISPSHASRTS